MATRSVAAHGMLLEQSQILTTHNLAVLVDCLRLTGELRERAPELAQQTFDWIDRRLAQRTNHRHAALIQDPSEERGIRMAASPVPAQHWTRCRGGCPTRPSTIRHPRLVVVDEAWLLMKEKSGADFLFRMAKASRKHWAGLTVAIQDTADVLGSDLASGPSRVPPVYR